MKQHKPGRQARCLVRQALILALLVMGCQCATTTSPTELNRSSANFYDDFGGNGIDSNRWLMMGHKFSQPGDGFLHFSSTGRTFQELQSHAVFTSGVFTMSFLDYWCDNQAPHSEQLGSLVALGLGTDPYYVRIERGQVRGGEMGYSPNIGGYVEVNWQSREEPWLHVEGVPSAITSGFLQIRYDGTRVSFYYRPAGNNTWTGVGPVLTPNWTKPVPLFIQAATGGKSTDRYTLRFKVDDIEVSQVGGHD
jgi:hypothetical protein